MWSKQFCRDQRASSAAEFALVLPLFLLLLLGTIDVGRYMWNVGQAEKATQMGARYAVVTDIIPGGDAGCGPNDSNATAGLSCFSYAVAGLVPQGVAVPESRSFHVTCDAANATGGLAPLACTCTGACPFSSAINDSAQTAFDNIVRRTSTFYGGIRPQNVRVDYSWSGLGYAGTPNGTDVDPIVTVSLQGLPFRPISLGTLGNLGLPGTSHSLTMEDGVGDLGN